MSSWRGPKARCDDAVHRGIDAGSTDDDDSIDAGGFSVEESRSISSASGVADDDRDGAVIRFLAGNVLFKELSAVCLDVGGVGYQVNMPIGDLARLGEVGAKAEVFVHTRVREDAIELFGFSDAERLSIFELLLAVNGVGPRMGLALLSGLDTQELLAAVQGGDEARLVRVPGVGKKTAARIVLELRDRLQKGGLVVAGESVRATDTMTDLRSALGNLGYKPPQIDKAVRALEKKQGDTGTLSLEELLVETLKHL